MSTITFGGLATGLDTNAIIDGLMQAERVPLTRLQTTQSNVNSARDTLSSFSSKLVALRSAAAALADPVQFASFAATSSDSSVVATVTGSAAAGSFDITVSALAHEQRTYSDAQTSSTAALGTAGTISLQVGTGTPVDVTVDATDSLSAIASKINASGLRVGASVIYDGSAYRLQVRGLDSGAAHGITFTESGTSLGLSKQANTYQRATDASLVVDGIPMTRSTNQVAGVIPGVTLALTKTTSTPTTVRIAGDPDGLTKKVSALVSAYNAVVSAGHTAAGFGTQKAANPELAGDSVIRASLDRIATALSRPITGATGKYTSLMSVGLEAQRDGTIQLNQSKLATALAADPATVAKLFVTDAQAGANGAMKGLTSIIDGLTTMPHATIQNRIDALSSRSLHLDDDIASMQRRLDAFQTTLQKQFTQLETIVSQAKNQGNALAGITSIGGS